MTLWSGVENVRGWCKKCIIHISLKNAIYGNYKYVVVLLLQSGQTVLIVYVNAQLSKNIKEVVPQKNIVVTAVHSKRLTKFVPVLLKDLKYLLVDVHNKLDREKSQHGVFFKRIELQKLLRLI